MLKTSVLRQKQEKERLIALHYIERDKYQDAKKWLESDLIKVVLGPRRAGKSVFCLSLLKDKQFMYFNFDDESLSTSSLDTEELMRELHSAYGSTKVILFDEIQNLAHWELFVNRLQRIGYNLILTGSNARLLSKELATALTGRHIPLEILPFSFSEALRAKQDCTLTQYLTHGGYPEVVINNLDPRGYLGVLFDALLFKDVMKRHHLRFSEQIEALGSYLMSNATTEYTARKLANVLSFQSSMTLAKYLGYLNDAYLVFSLTRYNTKFGVRLRSPKKCYVVDNGFVTAKGIQHSPDNGKLIENLVFMEFVKRGFVPNRDLFYYRTRNDKEVDFLLKSGLKVLELIQVCYNIDNPATLNREIRSLIEAGEELNCMILKLLTWDEEKTIEKDGVTIQVIALNKWLVE